MVKSGKLVLLLVTLLIGCMVVPVMAADYPTSTVNFIVAYSPGGGTDTSARTLEPFLEKYLGSSIAIVNKPGGSGEVGFTTIAKSKPDGYTIGIVNLPAFFINTMTHKAAYSLDDFVVLANMGGSGHTIGVNSDSKIMNLQDLISECKEKPGVLTIGTSGKLSDDHTAVLVFAQSTGLELNHVPFKGAGPARTAVLGGHVDTIGFNIDESIPFVKAGQIRLLGVMSENRHPQLPDVPTFKEQGFDITSGSTRAIVAPKGVPQEYIPILREAVRKALNDPEYLEKVNALGQSFVYEDPEEYAKWLLEENERVKDLLVGAGIIQ